MNDETEDSILNAIKGLAKAQPRYDLVDRAEILSQNLDNIDRKIEALLFASPQPLKAQDIALRLGGAIDIGAALARLKRHYIGRGVNLVEVAGAWRFQTALDLAHLFEEMREEPRKLSRAALETLSIIAYHQPCTRAEIEEIRGVSISRGTLDLLIDIKWIRPAARRRSPGKPLTYRTTDEFLAHFNLAQLDDLPGKVELQAQGLLSSALPKDFDIPRPSLAIKDDDDTQMIDEEGGQNDFVQDFFEPE